MKKLIGTFLPVMTNGDRIRAMTDEELARFIFRCMHINNKALCEEQVEDWLQQPAEEGHQ